ncbi:MAG: 16S rRNA (cytidine(1402)-2'-O)-methyltransferase, partial [Clostridia bacterium]|nr:16S rRNA (cytidine(1402)-2'-O)-methyltransferase [Clostridia bacterium]
RVIDMLKEGKEVALISDAGMPLISDPGSVLTARLREENLPYTVIPGTTAFVPALILAGYGAPFLFYGFLPEKNKERQAELRALSSQTASIIFYCAPHDVEKTIKDLYAAFGERNACAVREITKIYEEAEHFTLSQGVKEPKGEYVLIVSGAEKTDEFASLSEKEHIQKYLDEGLSKMDAIKRVAKERGVAKSSLYHYTVEE